MNRWVEVAGATPRQRCWRASADQYGSFGMKGLDDRNELLTVIFDRAMTSEWTCVFSLV